MANFLDKPKTEKYNESKTGAGLRYGLSSMQGWWSNMEDTHSDIIGIPDIADDISWFAVFDGLMDILHHDSIHEFRTTVLIIFWSP